MLNVHCEYMDETSQIYMGSRSGYTYLFDLNRGLGDYPEKGGYGKWLKNWK